MNAPPPPRARCGSVGPSLAALPTSGLGWDLVRGTAYEAWEAPSLSDGNATNDTSTLAGALVAARTGDQALAARTRASIMAVTGTTQYDEVLQLARNITSYVVAADVIGLPASDDARFRSFISGVRYRPLRGHSGGNSLYLTALQSPANWGTMARAAMAAIDVYLGDRDQLAARRLGPSGLARRARAELLALHRHRMARQPG